MTTALFLLRCSEIGINGSELDYYTVGMINDMFTERYNDSFEYKELAEQKDFDSF